MSDPRALAALRTIQERKAEILAIGDDRTPEAQRAFDELDADEAALVEAFPDALDELDASDEDVPGDDAIRGVTAALVPGQGGEPAPPLRTAGIRQTPTTAGYKTPAAPGPPVDPLTAFARGIRNPVGISDEMAGLGAAVASQFDDTRPMTPAASARAMSAAENEDQARGAEQHPLQYGLGRAITMAALTAPTMISPATIAAAAPRATALGRFAAPFMEAAQPVTAAGRMTAGGAEGAGLGGAIGAAESEDSSRLQGAAAGAAGGLAFGAAVPGVIAGARRIVDPLDNFASRMRGAAPGAYGGQVTQLTRDKGRGYLAEMGRTIERRGVDQRTGGPLLVRLPMGSGAYEQRLDEVLPVVGAEMDDVIMQAEQAGSKVPVSRVRDRLLKRAKEMESTTGAPGVAPPDSVRAQASKLREIAASLPDRKADPKAPTHFTPRELQAQKESWMEEVKAQNNPLVLKGGPGAEAYRSAASVPREMLDEQIERKVSPDQLRRFQQARKDYGHLKDARSIATKREGQETGNQLVSLPTMLAAGAGVGAGGVNYASDGDPLTSALLAGGTMALTKRYGKDALASFARGAQKAAQRVSRAPVAAEVNAAALASRQSPTMAAPAMAQQPAQSISLDDAFARLEEDNYAFGDATDAVLDAVQNDDQDALNEALSQAR